MFDRDLRLCHRAHPGLRAINARACFGCGDKTGIGVCKIVQARHQAGLRIILRCLRPVIAAWIWAIIRTVFAPVFGAVF